MKRHILAILSAGALWGLMGIFTRTMGGLGFDSAGTLIVRFAVASICFFLTLLIQNRALFRIRLRDLWCFLGAGICSLLFFTICYFQAIALMDLSAAAILLYTAPSMVLILSLFLFREKLTGAKILALVLAFAGCCLVSGIMGGTRLSAVGLLYGLGSGFGYALYSIFARLALNRGYDSRTINFYSILIALLGACLVWGVKPLALAVSSGETALWSLATGVVSCYLPYLLYTYGLAGVETGKASIMASTEPVVATLVGIFLYQETPTVWSALGVLLVLAAIVILNLPSRKRTPAT